MGQQSSIHSGRRRLPAFDIVAHEAEIAQAQAKWQAEQDSRREKLKKLEFLLFWDFSSEFFTRLPLTPCSENSWTPEVVWGLRQRLLHLLRQQDALRRFGYREIHNFATFHNLG